MVLSVRESNSLSIEFFCYLFVCVSRTVRNDGWVMTITDYFKCSQRICSPPYNNMDASFTSLWHDRDKTMDCKRIKRYCGLFLACSTRHCACVCTAMNIAHAYAFVSVFVCLCIVCQWLWMCTCTTARLCQYWHKHTHTRTHFAAYVFNKEDRAGE